MRASDFRAQARAALKGRWFVVTLLVVLAMLLGAGPLSAMDQNVVSLNLWDSRASYPAEMETVIDKMDDGMLMPNEDELLLDEEELLKQMMPAMAVFGMIFCMIALAVLAYSIFLGSYVRVGLVNLMDRLHDGEKPRAGMLFPERVYWRAVRLNLLRGLFVFLWTLLLVIPGIIAMYRYSMADYLLLKYPEMGAREALQESKRRMKSRKWRMFCLEFSFIGWQLLCALPAVLSLVVFGNSIANVQGPMLVFYGMMLFFVTGAVSTIASYFVQTYVNAAVVAFWREAQRCAGWHDEAREGADFAEEACRTEETPCQDTPCGTDLHHAAPAEPALNADETAARDMFLDYKCSRTRMREAGVLEEYEQLNIDSSMEAGWIRDYAQNLMLRFNRDALALDGLLLLAGEYGMDNLVSRVLERIERHARQQTLPDPEILNMAGRVLALLVSGAFAGNEGFVQRKKQQIYDLADRLEQRLLQTDADGWQDAMRLIRSMCG